MSQEEFIDWIQEQNAERDNSDDDDPLRDAFALLDADKDGFRNKVKKIREWRIPLWWLVKSHLASIWLCVSLYEVNLCQVRLDLREVRLKPNIEQLKNSSFPSFSKFDLTSRGMDLTLRKITFCVLRGY